MLEACDHRKELPLSRTVVTLKNVHNSRKKSDRTLYAVHRGRQYRAYRHTRRIGVKYERLIGLRISQCYCLGEGTLEVLEVLLRLWRPGETNSFLGQCRKWSRDASKIFDKLSVL